MTAASVSGNTGVENILSRLSADAPASTALIVNGSEYTFEQLAAAAERLATRLVPGTQVLVQLANNAASVVAIHAAWRAGCSVVTASTMVPEMEVQRRATATRAASLLTPIADNGLDVDVVATEIREAAPAGEAVVMFTSGTTGTPKGASLTFSALRGSLAGIAKGNGIAEDGRPPSLRPADRESCWCR